MEFTNLLAGFITLGFSFLTACIGYASGFKAGSREGYSRGRAVSRHASSKAVTK